MENEGQVLTSWQAPLSLPPSASLNVLFLWDRPGLAVSNMLRGSLQRV